MHRQHFQSLLAKSRKVSINICYIYVQILYDNVEEFFFISEVLTIELLLISQI